MNLSTTSEVLTKEQFLRVLPKKCTVTDEIIDDINGLLADPQLRENFRDNLLSYTSVMNDGRYKLTSYVSAVRYVSHKLLGSSNIEAYCKTFPDRYNRMVSEGMDNRQISSFSSAYNKTELVNKIYSQTLVPTHVLNADLYQKAINVQAALMIDDEVSPKVRSDAANSLLTHLKMPETSKIELDVNVKQDSAIDELRASTLELVKQQRLMLEAGAMDTKEVAESKLITVIEGEVLD